VSANVVRRIRLPADSRTPAAARAVVRDALLEADLAVLVDEALLLTTELSTNGVQHAGTDIDLEVIATEIGVTVTVTDYGTGRAVLLPQTGDLNERGRGLLLVDHFAASWGTTHDAKSKGVWFRLIPPGLTDPAEAGAQSGNAEPAGPRPASLAYLDGAVLRADALGALARLDLPTQDAAALAPLVTLILHRLCAAVGATGGAVRLDQADGEGLLTFAEHGLAFAPESATVRAALPVSWPWRGELVLCTPSTPSPYAAPLAEMTAERLGLSLENDRLRHADLRRQSWLTFLAEASELLAQSLDVDLTLALIPRLVVPRLGQWAAIYGIDEWHEPVYAAAAHIDEAALPQLLDGLRGDGPDGALERLREAVRTGVQAPLSAPVEGFAVPLTARGSRLGVLAVGRHPDRRQDPEEVAIVDGMAHRAALALDNARIHAERRRVAQTLQQSLLPPVLPTLAGVGLGAEYVPTLGDADVGGDFYDLVPIPDGRWLVVIGDVSGKGVQAATVTGLVRDVIRVLVRDGRTLPELLSRVNETLVDRGGGRYCTLAMAALTVGPAQRLDVALHLAGHDRPVLVGRGGRVTFVGTPGTALGLLERVRTPGVTITLEPGETLVFYTDGVTERRRGSELFGVDRLSACAAGLSGYSADLVAARLRAAALGFSAEPPRDDIAILALRNELAG
jgi:serine phosphatase RsbU (regulator of sigma subunit)/anti-sigma regulatory factor (Ser/Thr protein kinase)